MADIYGSHFTYGGLSSKPYDLIFANVETDRFAQVAGTISGVKIFNKNGKRNYLIDDDYSESPLSFDIDIVTGDGSTLSRAERHNIERWLFNRHRYRKLYINPAYDCDSIGVGEVFPYRAIVSGSVGGIKGYSLALSSSTPPSALYVYFEFEDGYSASNFTFTIDGDVALTDENARGFFVKTAECNPNSFDRTFVIKAASESSSMSITCSVLSYTYDVLSNEASTSMQIRNAINVYKAFISGADVEYINGEPKDIYLECRFISPTVLEYNGGIIGYRATLEASSGYWIQEQVTETFAVDNSTEGSITHINIAIDTDIDDYTYPEITVVIGNTGGDVSITNYTDSTTRHTSFVDVAAGATIVIDSSYNYISGQYYLKFSNQNFPRLLNGNNDLVISGDVQSVTVRYNNRRNFR